MGEILFESPGSGLTVARYTGPERMDMKSRLRYHITRPEYPHVLPVGRVLDGDLLHREITLSHEQWESFLACASVAIASRRGRPYLDALGHNEIAFGRIGLVQGE